MFQSIQRFAGTVDKWKITDDDFTENIVIDFKCSMASNNGCIRAAIAAIKCYEEKNLPVVLNLIRLFLYYGKADSGWTVKSQMHWQNKYNKNYIKYKEDVEKYLLLL